jgi:Predicted xylanase/chitin deacetylase
MRACFTIDLDRDVNFLDSGNKAGSLDTGKGTAPRFSSSEKGAAVIQDVLDETGIKATFFAESTTLSKTNAFESICENEIAIHGVDHEDITLMNEDELEAMLGNAFDTITGITGKRPKGFRAPFMKYDERSFPLLKELGVEYDSSSYGNTVTEIKGMTEIPVSQGIDANGRKIAAYLWSMHEGTRSPDDYVELAMKNSNFVFATHTWHMTETRGRGLMDAKEITKNKKHLAHIINSLLDNGFKFVEMGSMI